MRFKIDWASLILGRKFTVFLCFTLYLKTISEYKPPPPPRWGSAYIRRGDLTDIALISFLVEVWKKTLLGSQMSSYSGARERSSITISQFSSCIVAESGAESGVHSTPRSVFRKPQFSHTLSVILILSNSRKCMGEIKVF